MFHKYKGTNESGYECKRVGLNSFWMWFLFISFAITLYVSILQSQKVDYWFAQYNEALRDNGLFAEAEKKWNGDYYKLLTKYQVNMCEQRHLIVTQVENTKLCMDPDTKALFKIDRDRDVDVLWYGRVPLESGEPKNIWPQGK